MAAPWPPPRPRTAWSSQYYPNARCGHSRDISYLAPSDSCSSRVAGLRPRRCATAVDVSIRTTSDRDHWDRSNRNVLTQSRGGRHASGHRHRFNAHWSAWCHRHRTRIADGTTLGLGHDCEQRGGSVHSPGGRERNRCGWTARVPYGVRLALRPSQVRDRTPCSACCNGHTREWRRSRIAARLWCEQSGT